MVIAKQFTALCLLLLKSINYCTFVDVECIFVIVDKRQKNNKRGSPMSHTNMVAVTGIGLVSAVAMGNSSILTGIANKCGIDWLTLFDQPGKCEHAAEISDEYDWKNYMLSSQHYASRTTMIAAGAARIAFDEAGVELPYCGDCGCGICFGTRWGNIDSAQKFYEPVSQGNGKRASSQVFSHSYPNSTVSLLAIDFDLNGYSNVFAGSADSGMHSLFSAISAVATGVAPIMIAGASDALCPLVVAHGETVGDYVDTSGMELDFAAPENSGMSQKVPGEAACFAVLQNPEICAADKIIFEVPVDIIKNSPSAIDTQGLKIGDCGSVLPLISFLRSFI